MNLDSHTQQSDAQQTATVGRLAGKYMTFRVGGEDYALGILKVRELIGLLEITRVPHAPDGVKGVVNLRGKVIPVVDLKHSLGITQADASGRPVIIVVQVDTAHGPLITGVLVDQVLEVRTITEAQLEPPPAFSRDDGASQFVLGIAKTERRVVLLLDIDRVLAKTNLTLSA